MVIGQGYGLGIGGCKRSCHHGRGAWLSYTAFPVWSVKDRSLHKPLRQVTDLLSRAHTWVWTLGRLVSLLSWVLALFGLTVRVVFGWRSLHCTESETQGWGLGVPIWTET